MTPDQAFQKWTELHPAMLELAVVFPLFRPFMTRVVKCLLGAATGGTGGLEAEEWDNDVTADHGTREVHKGRFRSPGEYTKDDEDIFARGLKMERLLLSKEFQSATTARVTKMRTATTIGKNLTRKKASEHEELVLTTLKTKHTLIQASTAYNKKENIVYGQVTGLIRAPADDVLAFVIDIESRAYNKHDKGTATVVQKVLATIGSHRQIVYSLTKLPKPFKMREFLGDVAWRAESENNYLHVYVPTEHGKAVKLSSDVVRGEIVRATRIVEVSPGVTRLTNTFTIDMKGLLPSTITKNFVIPAGVQGTYRLQKYFICMKQISEFDKHGEDAAILATIMMDDILSQSSKANREGEMKQYFVRASFLRAVSSQYPWFQALLWNIIRNKVRPARASQSSLMTLSSADAEAISKSFAVTLLGSTTAEMATDEWILAYPAMRELDKELAMFRPFVTVVARVVLGRATWGSKMRVVVGALLSLFDVASDINMIRQYFITGKVTAAVVTLILIALSLAFQLFVVLLQNRKMSLRIKAREVLIVLSFMKPGFDAYRVLQGGDKDPLLTIDPLVELILTKAGEVALEALGAMVLQSVIILRSDIKTPVAIFSLATSAMTTAYTVTTITFDMDTSAEGRRMSPELWGMIPDEGRGLVFILMFLLGLCQVVAKVFSIALLATTNSLWLLTWLLLDLLVYLLYKAVRRDFVYYVPGLSGGSKYTIGFISRVLVKATVDMTGMMLLRNPYEMGGVYFALSMAASQVSCWIAAFLYGLHGDEKIDIVPIYIFVGVLQALWALSLVLFFSKIKRAYWKTFYSTQSGRQNAMSLFRDHKDDELKIRVFINHEDLWSDIRGEVKEYTHKKWATWESEKPDWFGDNFKALVSDEFIPEALLKALNTKTVGGKRRRSSMGGILQTVVSSPDSLRRKSASIVPVGEDVEKGRGATIRVDTSRALE